MGKVKKRFVCYLHHPAHFHYTKNVVKSLKEKGHQVLILCQKKDVLDQLLTNEGFEYRNLLPRGRAENKIGMLYSLLRQDILTLFQYLKFKPDLAFGSSGEICHIGRLLNVPSLYFNEDDLDVVPLLKYIVYPFATKIVTPDVCNNNKWDKKSIKYSSYHELAYLHPNVFVPNKDIVNKYINTQKPYFLLRFAKLTAHHDDGIKGLEDSLVKAIIFKLEKLGNIYITSEREINSDFEKYRININPIDMHHVMAFAKLYIGDSQTMAAEAGVLGTPFIRYNDFVGRIGYLKDLEDNHKLGYGVTPPNNKRVLELLDNILSKPTDYYTNRKEKMLSTKIDATAFFTKLIEEFPNSLNLLEKQENGQLNYFNK